MADGATIPRYKPLKNSAGLGQPAHLGANEHETRLPDARGRTGGNLLYLRPERVQTPEVAVQRKHLCAVDAVRILAPSLRTDLEQPLDLCFQIGPFSAQQRQSDAIGPRPVLMQPEAGRTEGFILLQKNFQLFDLARLEVVQSLPIIGIGQ